MVKKKIKVSYEVSERDWEQKLPKKFTTLVINELFKHHVLKEGVSIPFELVEQTLRAFMKNLVGK